MERAGASDGLHARSVDDRERCGGRARHCDDTAHATTRWRNVNAARDAAQARRDDVALASPSSARVAVMRAAATRRVLRSGVGAPAARALDQRQTVPVPAKTWRVIAFDCVMPPTVYVNVAAFPLANTSVPVPATVATTFVASNAAASYDGPVVR